MGKKVQEYAKRYRLDTQVGVLQTRLSTGTVGNPRIKGDI
jgi:hypothetical protein